MNKLLLTLTAFGSTAWLALPAEPALTIYNQDFAVVRDSVPLDLKSGVNDVRFADTTAQLEPDSVILRDPSGKVKLQVLEQNYRNDPVSQELLLSLFEGKTIDFLVRQQSKPDETVRGKIIRSGYGGGGGQGNTQPVIEVDGRVQFGLPGQPLFPSLGDDTILKPTLSWKLNSDAPGQLAAELAYMTGGLRWEADYNIVAPEDSDLLDVVGWITMTNRSGKTFQDTKIKLMAGDVNKIQNSRIRGLTDMLCKAASDADTSSMAVTEKSFEDFHLYSLPRLTTLHDGETKQVEFIHAAGVKAEKVYVYDGFKSEEWDRYGGYGNMANIRQNQEFGTDCNTKVAILREFKNSEANQLGMALPKGRIRFYKQDGQQLEFTGENMIDHTAKDELIKIYTGNAFDLVGERKRTDFKVSTANDWADESFEIKVRNHKKEAVHIRVVEHLYRWVNWNITQNSDPFTKSNAQEIRFDVALKPDEEKTITYKVHYSW